MMPRYRCHFLLITELLYLCIFDISITGIGEHVLDCTNGFCMCWFAAGENTGGGGWKSYGSANNESSGGGKAPPSSRFGNRPTPYSRTSKWTSSLIVEVTSSVFRHAILRSFWWTVSLLTSRYYNLQFFF